MRGGGSKGEKGVGGYCLIADLLFGNGMDATWVQCKDLTLLWR